MLVKALIPVLIAMVVGGQREMTECLVAGFGLLGVFFALVHYFTTRFGIGDGLLVYRSGLIQKKIRTIPLERIQNVNFNQSLLHQVLGIVDVDIETGGGHGAEASLSALSKQAAEDLKAELMQFSPTSEAVDQPHVLAVAPPKVETLYKVSNKELLLAGATENKALVIVVSAMALLQLFFHGDDKVIVNGLERLPLRQLSGSSAILVSLALFAVLILVGWIASIVQTVIVYHAFELQRVHGRIYRRYGLLTRVENVIPLRRVQSFRFSANPIQRLLRVSKLYVETAGGFKHKGDHQQSHTESDMVKHALFAPLVENSRIGEMAHVVFPSLDLNAVNWKRVSPKTVQLHSFRTIIPNAGFSIAPGVIYAWSIGVGCFVALMLISAVTGVIRYRTLAYDLTPEYLLERKGIWRVTVNSAPVSKIQEVAVTQSPGMRRMKVKSVKVFLSGLQSHGHTLTVPDIPVEIADELAWRLHRMSASLSRGDGL